MLAATKAAVIVQLDTTGLPGGDFMLRDTKAAVRGRRDHQACQFPNVLGSTC